MKISIIMSYPNIKIPSIINLYYLDVSSRGFVHFLYKVYIDQIFSSEVVQGSNGPTSKCFANKLDVFSLNVFDDHSLDFIQEVNSKVRESISEILKSLL